MALATLKKRHEFLSVRGGARFQCGAFVLEARRRRGAGPSTVRSVEDSGGVRFGFTVTKRLGNAVVRNRIRRRLKAAVGEVAPGRALAGVDYVIIARDKAPGASFSDLVGQLGKAFDYVNQRLDKVRNRPAQGRSTGEGSPPAGNCAANPTNTGREKNMRAP